MTDVVVNGITYTIKKFTLRDRKQLTEATGKEKNLSPTDVQAIYINKGCINPTLSVESILDMEGETADKLYLEVIKNNTIPDDFLSELKKLQSQELLQSLTPR